MYVPPRVVTNHDLERLMDTSDEWIQERTGIVERRYADEGVGCTELAAEACNRAMDAAGIGPQDVDALIVATLTPDYYMPGTSALLQSALGLGTKPALDIRCQCSGFLYGLNIANLYVSSGQYDRVLLVGVEIHSRLLNLSTEGRDVAVLFGDGAGAVLVEPCEDADRGIMGFELRAEGSQWDKLFIQSPSIRQAPFFITKDNIDNGDTQIKMKGRIVFKNAVRRITQVITDLLQSHAVSASDIDQYVVHQANQRITESVMRQLSVRESQIYTNVHKYGNCSAASIPMVLDEVVRTHKIRRGDLICMAAFGSGFTWGSALLRW